MTQTVTKEVTILARLEIKADPRKVVYTTLSSDGVTKYETTLFDGLACSCTCPAKKPCYHMTGCEKREYDRKSLTRPTPIACSEQEDTADEEEYRLYCIEQGYPARLTREQYCQEFAIYG